MGLRFAFGFGEGDGEGERECEGEFVEDDGPDEEEEEEEDGGNGGDEEDIIMKVSFSSSDIKFKSPNLAFLVFEFSVNFCPELPEIILLEKVEERGK